MSDDWPLGADCDVDAMLGPHGLREHPFGDPQKWTIDSLAAVRPWLPLQNIPSSPQRRGDRATTLSGDSGGAPASEHADGAPSPDAPPVNNHPEEFK